MNSGAKLLSVNGEKISGGTDAASTGHLNAVSRIHTKGIEDQDQAADQQRVRSQTIRRVVLHRGAISGCAPEPPDRSGSEAAIIAIIMTP